jgi:hypothetical protein
VPIPRKNFTNDEREGNLLAEDKGARMEWMATKGYNCIWRSQIAIEVEGGSVEWI